MHRLKRRSSAPLYQPAYSPESTARRPCTCPQVLRLKGTLVEAQSVWDVLYFKPKVTHLDQCLPAFMQIDRTTQCAWGPAAGTLAKSESATLVL